MPRIFISYRREDTEEVAGRLYDTLKARFGSDRVFRDIYTLRPGEEFAAAIDRVIADSEVVLVLIGRDWLNVADGAGRRRLDDPRDLHRREIAAALARNKRVIPVRVQGAVMPEESALSEDIAGIAWRNAVELSDARWEYDVEQLARALREGPLDATPRRSTARLWLIAAGGLVGGLVVTGALILMSSLLPTGSSPTTTPMSGPSASQAQASPAPLSAAPTLTLVRGLPTTVQLTQTTSAAATASPAATSPSTADSACPTTSPSPVRCTILTSLSGHTGPVWGLSFAVGGSRLASSGYGKPTAIAWEASGSDLSFGLKVAYAPSNTEPAARLATAWSPTSDNAVATGGSDGSVQVWDGQTGAVLYRNPQPHTAHVWAVAWDANGAFLASGGEDGRVQTWAPASSSARIQQQKVLGAAYALAWISSDRTGGVLAVGAAEGHIVFWDTRTDTKVEQIPKAGREVRSLAWSSQGKALAAGNEDGSVRIWQEQPPRDVWLAQAHSGYVRGLSWSPDGKLLASGGADGVVKLWQWTGNEARLVGEMAKDRISVYALAWSPEDVLAIGREDPHVELVRIGR